MPKALLPPAPARFVETELARDVREAVEWACLRRWPIVVTGPAGIGKTTALAELARSNDRAAFVSITPGHKSMRQMLAMICDAFGSQVDRYQIHDLADVLDYRLPIAAENGRFLIVDEVQLLGGQELLQLVKYSELFLLPVVLAGNEYALKKTRANAAAFDQVESRIGRFVRFKGVTEGDLAAFCAEHNVEGPDAHKLVIRFGSTRFLREVMKLLGEARQFAGATGSIRHAHLVDALKNLYGPAQGRAIATERTA
jgi:hypothetical protein